MLTDMTLDREDGPYVGHGISATVDLMRERNINTRNTREDERDNFNKASILSSLQSMEFIHSLGIDLDGVVRWSFDVCCMVDKNHISTGLEIIIHLGFSVSCACVWRVCELRSSWLVS